MPANECVPFFEPGRRVTAKSTGTTTGKRAVVISGNVTSGTGASGGLYSVVRAGAGVGIFGIAAFDASSGNEVTVIKGGIVPVTSGAAIAANAEVETDSTGRVITKVNGVAVGRCLTAVGAADLDTVIDLYVGGASSVGAGYVAGDQTAVTHLTNSTGVAGDDVIADLPAITVAAAAATAVTDAMLTDGTVNAAGVNTQLANLAADIIAKVKTGVDASNVIVEDSLADLTDKLNTVLTRLESAGLLTP